MATHSSVLAWRIPGMGEPGGLLSLGSHRVGHDWSDLAVAADISRVFWFEENVPQLSGRAWDGQIGRIFRKKRINFSQRIYPFLLSFPPFFLPFLLSLSLSFLLSFFNKCLVSPCLVWSSEPGTRDIERNKTNMVCALRGLQSTGSNKIFNYKLK